MKVYYDATTGADDIMISEAIHEAAHTTTGGSKWDVINTG